LAIAEDDVEKVLAKQGAFSQPILARCRIRHFTDGVAIGSKAFIPLAGSPSLASLTSARCR
jgi:hypothetical protein